MLKIKPEELTLLAQYIHNISGIFYDWEKAYLFESRLRPLLKEFGLLNYTELYHKAKSDPKKVIEKKIIDAISTNETLFFRDTGTFELLRHKIIPDLIDAKRGKTAARQISLKIWSSACSTGQEIYSIAIVLKELLSNPKQYNIKLLGTDISDAAVTQASSGKYNRYEIERGLEKDKLQKFFTLDRGDWKLKDEIRSMASFKKQNLMLPFNGLGKFDIIFCRNVAIYFSMADRKKLFSKLAGMLVPGGCLIIGSTESLTDVCPIFAPKRHLSSVYYQLNLT